MTTSTVSRTALLLAAGALLATGCTDSGADPGPAGSPTTSEPTTGVTPNPGKFDEQTAAALVTARFDAVYGLPPTTSPDRVDVEAAGDGIVVPGSPEADRLSAALNQAIETATIPRGDVLVETLAPPESTGEQATATLCMSQDIRTTELETGEETGAPAPPDDWLRIEAEYQRVDSAWLIVDIAAAEPANCVPPSIDAEVAASWETFTAAWREWERTGGDVSALLPLVTDDHAEILEGFPSFDPVESPGMQTDLQLHHATRTRVEGDWCRNGRLEEGVWQLVDGQWLVSDAGTFGTEPKEDPRCT